jgi:hypothetical protein
VAGTVQYGREGEPNVNDGEGTGIAGLEGPTISAVEPAGQEKRRRGPNETVILTLFFLVCLASVGLLLWHEETRLLDDPEAKAQRGEIVGAEDDSLVRAANFERALREIDGRLGERDVINSVRLSPVRVDVTAHDETGKQRILSVDPGFDIDEREFGESEQPGVRVRAIDPAAPGRIFAVVAQRSGAKPENLDYFVYSISANRSPSWLLYLDGVPIPRKQWEADARGRDVRRRGEPSGAEAAQQSCLQRARSAEDAARCQK